MGGHGQPLPLKTLWACSWNKALRDPFLCLTWEGHAWAQKGFPPHTHMLSAAWSIAISRSPNLFRSFTAASPPRLFAHKKATCLWEFAPPWALATCLRSKTGRAESGARWRSSSPLPRHRKEGPPPAPDSRGLLQHGGSSLLPAAASAVVFLLVLSVSRNKPWVWPGVQLQETLAWHPVALVHWTQDQPRT